MCAAKQCLARDKGEPKIGCRVNGVGYKLNCKHCLLDGTESSYIGETGKNAHTRILNHQSKFRSKSMKTKEESAFYKHIANSHIELYTTGDELEKHFEFHILKVFKYPLDREVDEGVRMVMHKGSLINSKTEWFSPSIVRTTIEKGGVEMAYQPARGFRQSNTRSQSANLSHPSGRSEVSCQPSNVRSQQDLQIHPQGRNIPEAGGSQPAGPVLSAREERMRKRYLRIGNN